MGEFTANTRTDARSVRVGSQGVFFLKINIALTINYAIFCSRDVMQETTIQSEAASLFNKVAAEIANERAEIIKHQDAIEAGEKRIKKKEVLQQALKGVLSSAGHSIMLTGYGTKSEIVKTAINQMVKPHFTQTDIEDEIKRINPDAPFNRNRVRATLWTLQHRGETIKLVSKGNNRRPAVYEKLSGPQPRANSTNESPSLDVRIPEDFKRIEVTESGRRPYGTSGETILSVLKAANGKPLKMKQVVALSGCAYGTASRLLRGFEKDKKVRRDKGQWALI